MIHKGFDFSQLGGFPLNQQRLEYMQTAYTGIADALVGLVGGNAIVSGCVVAGNNVSAGWVVIGGELLPFLGSSTGVQTTVLVRETKTALKFYDNTNKEVQFSRFVQFGTGTGAIAWSSLVRVPSLISIKNQLETNASNLKNHTDSRTNPHGVTKSQVGLSNIPNAKTDDPSVSDSDILATSKMVFTGLKTVNDNLDTASKRINVRSSYVDVPSGQTSIQVTLHYTFDISDYAVFVSIDANTQFALLVTATKTSNTQLQLIFKKTSDTVIVGACDYNVLLIK